MQINETSSMTRNCLSLLSAVSIVIVVYLLFSFTFLPNHYVKKPAGDLNYGIVIDAGSTGSRLFLYAFTGSSDEELINVQPVKDENNEDVVKKVTPGLSSFESQPEAAADYIKPLLNYASMYIPVNQQPLTPVFIFATAGMRLLTKEKQDAITSSLKSKLPKLTKLQISPAHIQVIDGKWEGIYSWIAVNYVLENFKTSENRLTQSGLVERGTTAGMIDMGGASVQIAFELPRNTTFNKKETIVTVNLGSNDENPRFAYKLFVTTFLGFGVNEGFKKYEHTLFPKVSASNSSEISIPYVRDNCLPVKMMKVSSIENGTEFLRIGTGDWDLCVNQIVKILKMAGDCLASLNCFFDGVEAPPVDLSSIELYGFSEYWYSMHDVLALSGVYHHQIFEKSARKFCTTQWDKIKNDKAYLKADVSRLEGQCFKSAWIHAILHDGFHVNELKHKFQTALRIRDQEVQWALGALIYQMRYFTLRNTQENYIQTKYHGLSAFYPILMIVYSLSLFGFVIFILKRYWNFNSRLFFKRDSTNWDYKKLNQNLCV